MGLSPDAAELWGAARTVAMHVTGGRCARCQPDGLCVSFRWAARLRQWERDRAPAFPAWGAGGWSSFRISKKFPD
jgi:hypothetical protein